MGGAKQDEKSIFNAVRRIGSAEARREYLARACEGDPELQARVEGLLRVYYEDDSFLRTAGLGVGNPFAAGELGADHARGTVIGPYTLTDRLGEGGMGVVYLAEQIHPVRRQVALKIVRPGMDTGQIVARLGAEREALALMDHPNIARVLDAGVTAPGRPYFVMELVRGVPITRYCDGLRLPLTDRLELFAQVCRGVQHAHQKGVIHRDLKPSNVLVTVVDGKPVPKIIDFGLAKVIGGKSAEGTLLTQVGVVVGTPDYMSPEQADPGCRDIDTRSDVYALGVLLYELLTGVTPLSRGGEAGRLADILFRIREEQPARPSARLRDSPDLAAVAAARGAEPPRLVRLVRGDLDWVVMRCLEKDRARRYDSADGPARDVERYLRHEPVEASPPGIGYRLKRFARRHRVALATAAGFVLLLVGGAAMSAWQAVRAMTAERAALADRDRAEAARSQARRALNKLTDEAVERLLARQGRVAEEDREFLRQVLSLHEEFAATVADSPETRAAVAAARFRVGVIRYRLGEFSEAEAAYRGAIDLRRALAEEFPGQPEYRRDLALSHVRLGALLRETGRPRPAEESFITAVGLSRKLAEEFPGQSDYHRDLAVAHNHLGNVLIATGRPQEAEAALRTAVDLLIALTAPAPATAQDRHLLAGSYQNLGILLFETDRAGPAEECYLKARDLFQSLADEFPGQTDYRRDRAQHLGNLGVLYTGAHRWPEAEEAYRASADAVQKLADEFPNRPEYRRLLARGRANLGHLLARMERHAAADEAYLAARDAYARLAADYPAAAEYQIGLAKALVGLGSLKSIGKDHAAAARLLEEALTQDRAAVRAESANPAYREAFRTHLSMLAEMYGRAGDHAKAADAADELARFAYEPAADAYTAAWIAIRCAGTAQRDERLTEAERERLAESYAERAVGHLQAAVRHGFKDGARLRKDPAFEALHPRDDFRKLLRDIDSVGRP